MNPALSATTRALFAALGGHAGWLCVDTPTLRGTFSPSAHPALNVVFAGDDIDAALRLSAGGLTWKLLPDADPRLADRLRARGFVELPPSVPIVGPIPDAVEAIAATLPRAERVADADDARAWLAAFSAGFGLPAVAAKHLLGAMVSRGFDADDPIQHFVLRDGALASASGTLVRGPHGLGGVFNLAVHPEARRRRAGTGMLASIARHAHQAGLRELGQFSTPEGVPLYRPYGEVDADRPLRNFIWMGR
jgi:ribosomal protein S18 acetylase RimI-like enzyme